MKEYKFKITVVVPIYNVEKYLAEALDSVIFQSFGFEENIEIILVNDGSTDSCDSICREYQEKFPDNIVYLVKKNGGLSSARNYGIDRIRGKYVNFFDADDKWETTAFEKAYDFFEANADKIDVLSSRVRFFDAKDKWHPLDYKFNKGTRVVDVKKEASCVQVHVTSAFFKTEAVRNLRFNEKIRFGEDGVFANTLILDKLKYGVVADCVYYYRKRSDKTSLTQIQNSNIEYYTDSPKLYYESLINESEARFGTVIPYIQNVLAYDIGWRVRASVPDTIRKDRVLFANYLEFLNKILSFIEDDVFIRSKVHKRLSAKCAFYKLKHPDKKLIDIAHFDFSDKAVYVGNVRLYNFNKSNHSACIITDIERNGTMLNIRGCISDWLLSVCDKCGVVFALKTNGKYYYPEITDNKYEKDVTVLGDVFPYNSFYISINTEEASDSSRIGFCLKSDAAVCDISSRYKEASEELVSFEYLIDFSSGKVVISGV